ncbi:MAG: DUF4834 domain-containing protein [Bacteroidetes bacterium]|nr:DUF4834 domain-containing protein [Bacteroidota bacterium]
MLEFIFWFIIIYIVLRLAAKYFLPFIVKYYLKKFQQRFYQQDINTNRKEGETNVDYVPDKKSKTNNSDTNIGEYIDYEEIESK